MKTNKLILTGILTLAFSYGFSQKIKVRRANSNYNDFAYVKTSEVLLEVANQGYKSVALLKKLGDSYYFNNQMEDASKWYKELMSIEESNDSINPEYYFRYAQALKTIENYDEANQWMKRFNAERSDDLRSKAYLSNVNYLEKIDNASRDIDIKNLDINSPLSDFGAAKYNGQFVFASSRGKGKIYQWNEQPYLDLYETTKQDDGTYSTPIKLNDDINTKYHESSAAYTPNGQFMFFTRNNFYRRRYKKDQNGVNRLRLFRATLNEENGTWSNITPVHFNSNEYSVAHPTINANGTKLYFASDMPGTKGLSDIYVVNILEDGTLGSPKNLGNKINTEGKESFPFINKEGDLFFSSNGYAGLGGLDIYAIKDFENKSAKHIPQNLGKPFNSPNDDFGFYENFEAKEGFFTSNREGGKGDDDIYTFVPSKCKQVIEGIVKDKDTKELIANAKVILLNKNGVPITSVNVGNDAVYAFDADCNTEYLIRAEKETYISDEKRFTTISKKQESNLELLLDKDEQEITIGDDLAKVLDIPIIYFDFDKSNIRPDAAIELQKVIAVMNKYPSMKIDVRSHTDSRAPNDYNLALSSRRNKSTIKYLIEKGHIDASRLTGKGYGETQLINDCGDGKSCTEKEHQANRRSEFIIVEN